eukprot:6460518-Amphidinium_carterae.1
MEWEPNLWRSWGLFVALRRASNWLQAAEVPQQPIVAQACEPLANEPQRIAAAISALQSYICCYGGKRHFNPHGGWHIFKLATNSNPSAVSAME